VFTRLVSILWIVWLTPHFSEAATGTNLSMVVAKGAAAVKRCIPDSEAEAQGNTAVVKKRTSLVPRQETTGRMEVPDGYGMMFIIRLEPTPYKGSRYPTNPQFDRRADMQMGKRADIDHMMQSNRRQDAYLRQLECFRTTAMHEFSKSNSVMVVEILFGVYADTKVLQQAYAELIRTTAAELRE
jgi:hypothetical protein